MGGCKSVVMDGEGVVRDAGNGDEVRDDVLRCLL